jgi:hypothetical protein
LYYVALFLGVQISSFLIAQSRPGLAGVAIWMIGADRGLWLIVGAMLILVAIGFSLWRRPFWNHWRAVGFGAIIALMASTFMFRVYPSSHDERPSEVRFRLPLDGPILVGWGGATPDVNYHVIAPDQRWAYDLAVAKNGKTHAGDGSRLEDHYCYGLPVLAPAEGKVVAVLGDMPDQPVGVGGGVPAGGNQVVLEVAPKQFLFLCHLARGTITVNAGDQVTQGQPLAKVGNSGNTSQPHLHIHLQDTARPHFGEGIPLYFHDYRVADQVIDRGMPTGGFKWLEPIGQIVEHAGPNLNPEP